MTSSLFLLLILGATLTVHGRFVETYETSEDEVADALEFIELFNPEEQSFLDDDDIDYEQEGEEDEEDDFEATLEVTDVDNGVKLVDDIAENSLGACSNGVCSYCIFKKYICGVAVLKGKRFVLSIKVKGRTLFSHTVKAGSRKSFTVSKKRFPKFVRKLARSDLKIQGHKWTADGVTIAGVVLVLLISHIHNVSAASSSTTTTATTTTAATTTTQATTTTAGPTTTTGTGTTTSTASATTIAPATLYSMYGSMMYLSGLNPTQFDLTTSNFQSTMADTLNAWCSASEDNARSCCNDMDNYSPASEIYAAASDVMVISQVWGSGVSVMVYLQFDSANALCTSGSGSGGGFTSGYMDKTILSNILTTRKDTIATQFSTAATTTLGTSVTVAVVSVVAAGNSSARISVSGWIMSMAAVVTSIFVFGINWTPVEAYTDRTKERLKIKEEEKQVSDGASWSNIETDMNHNYEISPLLSV